METQQQTKNEQQATLEEELDSLVEWTVNFLWKLKKFERRLKTKI